MNYTELHLHTHYSLLDGLNTPDEYLKRGKELGMTHMAVTDHGVHTAHREFHKAAKDNGITPILGVEAYISATDRFDRRSIKKRDDNTQAYNHIGILAANETGLKNLNRLSQIAWTEGFYSKPRIDMEVLEEHSEGVIVLSGCMNGLVSKAIEKEQPIQARQYMQQFKEIFGDRFFVEIQGHNPPELNEALLKFAKEFNVLPVVTSDCHYARKEDLWIEEAMLILSTGPKFNPKADFSKSQKMDILDRFNYLYPERKMTFQEIEIFLRGATDQKVLLAEQGIGEEPIENTMVVAGMIEEYPYHEGLDLLPKSKTEDPAELLRKKVIAGAKKRGTYGKPEEDARREEELEIINSMGFAPYFLPLANAVSWAKNQGIRVGPGRGSGAGSQVTYELGITNVPPLEHNLLFFRFINPERNDYPDVDTDFMGSRRGEVKNYFARQYGHVASIATFGTFGGKRAVRDAARVFRVPLGEVNRALKGADWIAPLDWWKEWEKTDKAQEFIKKYPEVIKLAKALYGRIREMGMHAGGIVLSREPITEYAPMQSQKDPNDDAAPRIPVIGLDMDAAAEVGFIKYDILGLKALDVIDDTVNMVKERHGVELDMENLKLDDPKVWNMLSEGYTQGVFQCEQTPYTNLIIKMGGVRDFNDLVASNALVRPGAANSTAGQDYIDRKKGKKVVLYPHESMMEFTKDTYGTVIYQEQVMLTMTELAGMTMSEADKVRKIIGKKKDVSEFEEYKTRFIEGASKKVDKEVAERLWHDFEAHAGYSFNKSHSVAYSMLSFWTAYLKAHYPLEFMTAVLKNEGDKDKMLDYLIETKRLGIRIKLPHVNESGIKFEIQKDERGEFIRFGLSNVKYIKAAAPKLIAYRPFKNYKQLFDLVQTPGNGLNVNVLKGLNAVGGASFPDNPRKGDERDNYYEYLNIPAFESKHLPPKMVAQFRTLDEFDEKEAFVSMGMVRKIKTGTTAAGKDWARVEIVDETGTAGVFTNGNTPITVGKQYVFLIANNRIVRYVSTDEIIDGSGGDFAEFLMQDSFPDVPSGMLKVVAFNSKVTNGGKRMADVVLADEDKNMVSAMVWPTSFHKAFSKCKPGAVLDIQLRQTEDGTLFVHNIL